MWKIAKFFGFLLLLSIVINGAVVHTVIGSPFEAIWKFCLSQIGQAGQTVAKKVGELVNGWLLRPGGEHPGSSYEQSPGSLRPRGGDRSTRVSSSDTPVREPVPFGGTGQRFPESPATPGSSGTDDNDKDLKQRLVGTWEWKQALPDGSILLERSSYYPDGRESGSGTIQPPNKSLPPIPITYHGKWDIRNGYLYSSCEQSSIPICGFTVGAKILQFTDTELSISFLGSTLTYVRVSRK